MHIWNSLKEQSDAAYLQAKRLLGIGCFALELTKLISTACYSPGNAPFSNTRSVAELGDCGGRCAPPDWRQKCSHA